MKHYNVGTERCPLVCYRSMVNGLRLTLEGNRLNVVKEAFCCINGEPGAECFTIAQARVAFSYEEFEKWCEAIEVSCVDDEIVTWSQFSDFYADISMTIFDDAKFVHLVADSWSTGDSSHHLVNDKDVETLLAAMRHNLMKFGSSRHSEEFVLRDIFREFDADNSGALSLKELRNILLKINLNADDRYLKALLKKFDTNGNGVVEFEEFQKYIVGERYHKH